MKLAALCCTYLRPQSLGAVIESFLRQDYPAELRELVILDDVGQYENQQGDGWQLVSIPRRFHTLGEKRNACAALASPDVDGFLVCDDDDVYLPHWFRTTALALQKAEWSRPSLVLLEDGDGLEEHETEGLYHGGWAFRRDTFYGHRGYAVMNAGEDVELAGRMEAAGVSQCDPSQFERPFYIYRNDNGGYHLSHLLDGGYERLATKERPATASIQIGWPRDYATLPVVRRHDAPVLDVCSFSRSGTFYLADLLNLNFHRGGPVAHFGGHALPGKADRKHAVYIVRNPFDCLYSCRRCWHSHLPLDEYAIGALPRWKRHVEEWLKAAYWVRYEDLLVDLPGTLAPLGAHFGLTHAGPWRDTTEQVGFWLSDIATFRESPTHGVRHLDEYALSTVEKFRDILGDSFAGYNIAGFLDARRRSCPS